LIELELTTDVLRVRLYSLRNAALYGIFSDGLAKPPHILDMFHT